MPATKKSKLPEPIIERNGKSNHKSVIPESNGIQHFTKEDLLEAPMLSREQALALVGLFYSIQKSRVGASNKVDAHNRQVDILANLAMIEKIRDNLKRQETEIEKGFLRYVQAHELGRWALSIAGVGPVIAAGLLAHIDCNKAVTAGAVWRFAGQLPKKDQPWEKGQKRPYNAALKTLFWKLGQSFKKLTAPERTEEELIEWAMEKLKAEGKKNTAPERKKLIDAKLERTSKKSDKINTDPTYFYVKLYMQRKKEEIYKNEHGLLAGAAKEMLETRGKYATAEQLAAWRSGKLQPMGLDLRTIRYVNRFFISHYHYIGRTLAVGKAPEPWIIAHGKHTHFIPPPNWPMEK